MTTTPSTTTALDGLLTALATGAATVVDLTAPLSSETPILQLPEPFANTIPLSLEKVSDFDADGRSGAGTTSTPASTPAPTSTPPPTGRPAATAPRSTRSRPRA
ncbi:hypothetical protein [Pimelobacter simplex]|uniref:hypothetical protein n=1 Tax=Nocardioides simplex TaxID=2045 RepID=UPI0020B14A51|nr:hypothetical protein [Pimelobacter simplex]